MMTRSDDVNEDCDSDDNDANDKVGSNGNNKDGEVGHDGGDDDNDNDDDVNVDVIEDNGNNRTMTMRWRRARLKIPVFRNLFFGPKKPFLTGFLRIFFPAFSGGIFHWNVVLEGVTEIPVFSVFTGFFCRNSCGTGIPVFTPESSGFRRIPVPAKSCWLCPATKEGSLLSKIWTKIDLFKPLSQTGVDHGVRCPRPLLAPPGLKVRAAEEA